MAPSPCAEQVGRLCDGTARCWAGMGPAVGLRQKEPWRTGAAMAAAG